MNNKILITGSTGFVGSHLLQMALAQNREVICPIRASKNATSHSRASQIQNIDRQTDWQPHLNNVHTVIHCAARVHVMNDTATDPLTAFREVNLYGSLRLAEQAAAAGVRQFIYLSSVKVNGEMTIDGQAFSENDPPSASDPYGISKQEAEAALLELGQRSGMAITIIRPPLVYGKGVAANFLSLLIWVKKQIPLPLGSIHNQRSIVFVKNLCDFILHCVQDPRAFNQVFLVSDGRDLSTTELLQEAAKALEVPSRLLPFPVSLMTFAAKLIGKKNITDRLCQSLRVDSQKAQKQMEWSPPYTIQQGLRESAASLISDHKPHSNQ
ncbi:UDP-glucose 4-epimerase family protein [Undibacterium macrobrachii]|jgi:UDP-glucose 4-epimerase|uniref:UDP-glucose 4-epimerase n=1 Tax=Undibacterium macrobrachii TaxID=1119058 RepID=A0ABQ2XK07_9BURK|nr:SDR family oxidoreductase [Undibacterium macrobrachii]GGX18348.1 UDP-glucose 4-epimerase [Undibacterium macrobrachii]